MLRSVILFPPLYENMVKHMLSKGLIENAVENMLWFAPLYSALLGSPSGYARVATRIYFPLHLSPRDGGSQEKRP